jgi:hypothetical protein
MDKILMLQQARLKVLKQEVEIEKQKTVLKQMNEDLAKLTNHFDGMLNDFATGQDNLFNETDNKKGPVPDKKTDEKKPPKKDKKK